MAILVHCLPSFQSAQWTMGQSQLTMQEVQLKLKIKIIKNLKTQLQSISPVKGSSGGVERFDSNIVPFAPSPPIIFLY